MNKFLNKIKHLFIPHEGNNHEPHLLRHKSILNIFFFVIVVEILFLVQVFFVFEKTNFLALVLPDALTDITNEQRKENNLEPLSENSLLKEAANLKAKDMAEKGYFSHNTPDGKNPWYWLKLVGYEYSYAGENLAVNFFDSYEVAKAWMASPTHRANIVKENYTEIGIGVANGKYKGKDSVFVVQFFGTPTEKQSIIPIQNELKEIAKDISSSINTKPNKVEAETKPASLPKINNQVLSEATQIKNETTKVVEIKEENKTEENLISNTKDVSKPIKEKLNFFKIMLLSPIKPIKYTFGFLAIGLGLLLMIAIFISTEIKHPKMIFKGVALFSLIVFLFILNINASVNKTIISQEAEETSFIAS